MGLLNYTATMSLDGYIADEHGDFSWAVPTEEIFAVHLARMEEISVEILGRKTYQLMRSWDTEPAEAPWTPQERDFAQRWPTIDKVVVSTTLRQDKTVAARDRLVRHLSLADIRRIVNTTAGGIIEISGPTTAAEAIRAGIVNRFEFFLVPIILGRGLAALPSGMHRDLRLLQHQVFDNGTVYLRYEPA